MESNQSECIHLSCMFPIHHFPGCQSMLHAHLMKQCLFLTPNGVGGGGGIFFTRLSCVIPFEAILSRVPEMLLKQLWEAAIAMLFKDISLV